MEHKIGDLIKTALWLGIVIDFDIGEVRGVKFKDYKVYFFFDDNRLATRWCSEEEVSKWKKNLLDATK